VINAKVLAKHFVNFSKRLRFVVADKMDADSVLSLTDSPNVQAVNGNNTFNTHKCLSNRLVGNLHGSSFHQHGNAVSECFARSVKHNYGENVCADGVKVPQFVARHPNDKGSDNNAD